jgi:hypothetical protein
MLPKLTVWLLQLSWELLPMFVRLLAKVSLQVAEWGTAWQATGQLAAEVPNYHAQASTYWRISAPARPGLLKGSSSHSELVLEACSHTAALLGIMTPQC